MDQIGEITPGAAGCGDCLASADSWRHLRLCMSCGHVGCSDDSRKRHATRHFRATQHPIMRSFEPDESWGWCYVDQVLLDGAAWHIRAAASGSTE
ncbi:MAG: UBP-type zinc finger domain-containing protein [Chloroflexi bacterium]|nr:UBP-type zinc finger domain-containing protein [Chloroflexota bacterium]